MEVRDWRGTEIKVGDVVVFPSRQSSSIWMNEGEVVSIEERDHPWREGVKELKIGVKGTGGTGWRGREKKGRVAYPSVERITVVSRVIR